MAEETSTDKLNLNDANQLEQTEQQNETDNQAAAIEEEQYMDKVSKVLYKVPPDIEKAKLYAKSRKVGKPINFKENKETKINEFSYMPEDQEPFELCCPKMDLKELGAGFPLYFEYVTFCALLLLFQFIVIGLYNMLNNAAGARCRENQDIAASSANRYCTDGFIVTYSWANKDEGYDPNAQNALNLVFIILGVCAMLYLRKIQQKTADECDRGMTTPSDFTIIVRDLPRDATKDKIMEFFHLHGKEKTTANIAKINMAYKIGTYIGLTRQKAKLITKQNQGKANEEDKGKLRKIDEEIKDFEENLEKEGKYRFAGVAFVSFQSDRDAKRVTDRWNLGGAERTFYRIVTIFGCKPKKTFDGHVIQVERAPEPMDVLWENLGYTFGELFKKRAVTFAASLVLVGACFGAILGIKQGQEQQIRNDDNAGAQFVVSIVVSVVIVFINGLLGTFIRRFAAYEKKDTHTNYFISVAWKLSLAQFVNTGLITLFVHMIVKQNIQNIWVKDSIVYDVFFLYPINAFVPDVMSVFNPFYGIRLCRRRKIEKEGDDCKVTQAKANEIFDNHPFDMAQKYANIQKTMLFTAFYANLNPLGIIISFFGLLVSYWTDKILLLRRHARPQPLGPELSNSMATFLELFFVTFSAGNMIFENIIRGSVSSLNFVCLVISLIVYVIPSGAVGSCLFKGDETIYTQMTYNEARWQFISEYDRSNPLTQLQAYQEFVNDMENNKSEEIQQQGKILKRGFTQKMINQHNPMKMGFGNLANYAQTHQGLRQMGGFSRGPMMPMQMMRPPPGMPMGMRPPMMMNPQFMSRQQIMNMQKAGQMKPLMMMNNMNFGRPPMMMGGGPPMMGPMQGRPPMMGGGGRPGPMMQGPQMQQGQRPGVQIQGNNSQGASMHSNGNQRNIVQINPQQTPIQHGQQPQHSPRPGPQQFPGPGQNQFVQGQFKNGPPPQGFQQGPPPNFQQGPPRNFQQGPPGFQQGPPPNFQQGPPRNFQQGPPPQGFQQQNPFNKPNNSNPFQVQFGRN